VRGAMRKAKLPVPKYAKVISKLVTHHRHVFGGKP
jgi:hypothetical protein